MESPTHAASTDSGGSSHWFSRRGFLGKTAIAGSVAITSAALPGLAGSSARDRPAGPGAAGAAPSTRPAAPSALAPQREMVLQLARVGAVFPIDFPGFGESGPAKNRATAARLRVAERRLTARRLARARAGADALIAQGLMGAAQPEVLVAIGRHAAQADAEGHKDLVALVALGVATLSPHFDPADDAAAEIWLDGLRRCYQHDQRPQTLSHRN